MNTKYSGFAIVVVTCGMIVAGSMVASSESTLKLVTPIPEGEIKQVVDRIMVDVKRKRSHELGGLARRVDEALPYLVEYSKDPDVKVRSAIADVVSSSKSPVAVNLLSEMLRAGDDASVKAAYRLYAAYTTEQLKVGDVQRLQTNMLGFVRLYSLTPEATLLLSALGRTPEAIALLQKHRTKFKRESVMLVTYEESPLVPLPFCADIALAGMGDTASVQRITEVLSTKDSAPRRFLLQSIRFVEDKTLLAAMAELLKDNQPVEIVPDGRYLPMRVADLAYSAFQYKTGASRGLTLYSKARTPDAEINKMYDALKLLYKQTDR